MTKFTPEIVEECPLCHSPHVNLARDLKGEPQYGFCKVCGCQAPLAAWNRREQLGQRAATVAPPPVGVDVVALAVNALEEAEAILGGEYGDHYAPLCNKMMKLREALSTPPVQP